MIWYDASTGEPVAPGSCEDDGIPSIKAYWCKACNQNQLLEYEKVVVEMQSDYITAVGVCEFCRKPLLTTG